MKTLGCLGLYTGDDIVSSSSVQSKQMLVKTCQNVVVNCCWFFSAFRFYIRPCANWNCCLRCSMAVVPETCMSCLIINLDRLHDRLSRMRDLCKTLQLSAVSRVSAVDGHDLVQRGGRAKGVGKIVWCLCYDDPSAGRIEHLGHLRSCGCDKHMVPTRMRNVSPKSSARASWYVGPSSICPRAGSLHFHTLTRSIDDFIWDGWCLRWTYTQRNVCVLRRTMWWWWWLSIY